MGDLRLDGAHLIGGFVSFVTFGLYTCLFIQTCFYMKRATIRSITIPTVLTIMWLIALTLSVLRISFLYDTFVTFADKLDVAQFSTLWINRRQFTAAIALDIFSAILGNMFLCWRLFLLWKHDRKFLIMPLALVLGMTVCGFVTIGYTIKAQTDEQDWLTRTQWYLGLMLFTMAFSTVVMSMISWKIWRMARAVSDISPRADSFYQNVLYVFIESGALYTVTGITFAILKGIKEKFGTIIVAYMVPNIVGIVPTLIVLRMRISNEASQGGDGPDTITAANHQDFVSRPVFARVATDTVATTTTQVSDVCYSSQLESITTLQNATPVHKIKIAKGETLSPNFRSLTLDDPRVK